MTRTRFELLDMIRAIDESDDVSLTPWEINFIAGMIDNPPSRFTEKQAAVIERIHDGLGRITR